MRPHPRSADPADVYGVTTKRLNEQFRRNRKRFPKDFAFQLTAEEDEAMRSQLVIGLGFGAVANCDRIIRRHAFANCDRDQSETSVTGLGRLPSTVRCRQ